MYVNASTASGVSATTVAVPWASTTAGDWCLLTLALSALSTITDPTGFTALDTLDESTTLRFKSWWHRCTGSESGSLSVAWTGSANAAVAMVAYRYVDATTPVYGHIINGAVSTATSRSSAALSSMAATAEDVTVYADVQATAAQTWTPPAGLFSRAAVSTASTPFVSVFVVDPGPAAPNSSQQYPTRTAVSGQSGTAYVTNHIAAKITPNSAVEANNFAAATWTPADTAPEPTGFDSLVGQSGGGIYFTPATGQIWPRGKR